MLTSYPELASVGLGFKGGTSPGSASGSIHVKVEVVAHIHTESSLVVLSMSMRFTLATSRHCDPPGSSSGRSPGHTSSPSPRSCRSSWPGCRAQHAWSRCSGLCSMSCHVMYISCICHVPAPGVLLQADGVVVCRGPGGVDPILLLAGADLQSRLLRAGWAPVVLVEPLQMLG